ncbi:MAG: hypothetical protein C0392_15445, partial [Syntrophus sp. (in: bacteria)]|nr:hypothetical protein [Syntrophus sp. (in: bacteria)]
MPGEGATQAPLIDYTREHIIEKGALPVFPLRGRLRVLCGYILIFQLVIKLTQIKRKIFPRANITEPLRTGL